MTAPSSPHSALAPFRIRSFRFQWPADLATSWAIEMEILILGWYVLVETGSVLMLTVFASLLYIGTLLAPMFGVMGDRVGHRNVLCAMRGVYTALAAILTVLTFLGMLTPAYVLVNGALVGIVRPSDIGTRAAVVADTMPAGHLMGAMGIQSTTQQSARIAGALSGAGLVAWMGMGAAYVVVVSLYAISVVLTFKAGSVGTALRGSASTGGSRPSPWRDLREGFAYVRSTPHLLAMVLLAFLVNLTAFPLVPHLLPYVAKEMYRTGQTGLSYLVASFAFGALLGAIALSRIGAAFPPARMMVVCGVIWYLMIIVFALMPGPVGGITFLLLAGFAHSLCMVAMAGLLLRNTDQQFRGRVMGIRMMAIYGVPVGLLIGGPLIDRLGFPATAMLYGAIGLTFTALITVYWRADVWRLEAWSNLK